MINRRDLIIGGACVAAAAGAEVMRPNKRVSLLNDQKLDDVIPRSFGVWKTQETGGIIAPESESSLSAKLYSQTVARTYSSPDGGYVMLLIAYGNTQSDTLQLHRPEVCYPAFGFEIASSRAATLALSDSTSIPIRNLVATAGGREERISYWTRIGEYLPVDNGEQRQMRFRTALAGIIPDGVLVRISNTQPDEASSFALNERLAADLLQAVKPSIRPALVTTAKARQLSGNA